MCIRMCICICIHRRTTGEGHREQGRAQAARLAYEPHRETAPPVTKLHLINVDWIY